MSLFDPVSGRFLESNEAVVKQTGAPNRAALGNASPVEISPERQPDGRPSAEKAAEMVRLAAEQGSYRFEWMARRFDGTDLPIDVVLTSISVGTRPLMLCVSREISEQKRAQEKAQQLQSTLEHRVADRTAELSASEARLRTLIENAPEALVVFDGETGRFATVNDNAVALYGWPRERLLQFTPADVSPPFQPDGRPSVDAAREYIQAALSGERPVFDWLHVRPDGRTFTCEVRLVRLPSEGRPLVRASVFDTTERRRQEQTRRAVYEISEAVHTAADLPALYERIHRIVRSLMPAENFFIALFEAATEMISFPYFVDELATELPEPRRVSTGLTGLVLRTGKPILADPKFVARSRREDERIVVDGLGSYIESGRPAAVWLGVPLAIQGASIGVMAVQDYHHGDAYGEDEKQILSFVASQTALAIERKRSEESLRDLVEKHRALFESSSQGVMLQDDQQFLEVNPAAVRILRRRDPAEIVGRHPSEFAPERQPDGTASAAMAQNQIIRCLQQGSAHFEWTALAPDGAHVPMDVLLTRIQWRGRWLIQAMVEDITERKRAEAELLKALAHEKELSQLKSNFVSTVSHEFRTPLGIIMSSSQILADYFDRLNPEERVEHLRSIARNAGRMSSLMEEVLVLSRADAGKMLCERAALDLSVLCRRFADEVFAATHGVCPILTSVADGAVLVHADERLLRHIITNLLSNAVKYSPPGAPVRCDVAREDDEVVCRVCDQGIGIPEADLPGLFDAFRRGRNVGDRPGTGLGLTIVKRCVELHGGRVSVESAIGRGTTVTVRIPIPPNADL